VFMISSIKKVNLANFMFIRRSSEDESTPIKGPNEVSQRTVESVCQKTIQLCASLECYMGGLGGF